MTAPAPPLLDVIDVHAAYGKIEVLHGVSFAVPEGTVVALLGPNGAGKSTALKVISGQMEPTDGHVHLRGHHVNGAHPTELARAGMCTIPEGRGIFPNLTVRENLGMSRYLDKRLSEIEEVAYGRFPRLGERRSQQAGTLSGGEQQMLAMARALASDPGLLLLDELSMGLAPLIVEELYEAVAGIAAEGIAVLVIEQFARTALAIAEYGVVMQQGRVVAVGQPGDLAEALDRVYLGEGTAA